MKSINVEKKHSINTSDFRKFHVETSTFITNSGAMPAHQHKRKTPKTVLLTHITDHLQTGISKERRPSSTTEVPLLLNSRAPSAGRAGRACRVDVTLRCRGWVLWVFLGGGGL